MILGSPIAQICFLTGEWRLIRAVGRQVITDWLLHLAGAGPVIWLLGRSPLPVRACGVAVYPALSLLKIRTFLEHRAHDEIHA
jgi:hypothetical protein